MIKHDFSDLLKPNLPPTRLELSFSKASVQDLRQWISSLSPMHLGDSAKSLLTALVELSELEREATDKFALIQVLHPALSQLLQCFEDYFFDQGLMNTDRNEQIIELVLKLRYYFIAIYVGIAQASHTKLTESNFSFFSFRKKKNLQSLRILSLYYALEQLSQLLYQQYFLYRNPIKGQWQLSHQLYMLALKHRLEQVNINQLQGTHNVLKNIQQVYMQMVLLHILNTNQIRQHEIKALYECSFGWTEQLRLTKRHQHDSSKYVIYTTLDEPPLHHRGKDIDDDQQLYVSTQHLLEHVSSTLDHEQYDLSDAEQKHFTTALKFHVQQVLSYISQRRYERRLHAGQLQIGLGLLTAHFYLCGQKSFADSLALHITSTAESFHEASLNETTLNVEIEAQRIDRESLLIHDSEILDISVNGYRIKWKDKLPKQLKTGEFVLVRENSNDQFRGGIIRWIKQSAEKSLTLGLEVLSLDLIACAVRYDQQGRQTYYPAILIQRFSLDEQSKIMLVLPNLNVFKVHQSLYIRLNMQDVPVYLLQTELLTQSFIICDFEFNDLSARSFVQELFPTKS